MFSRRRFIFGLLLLGLLAGWLGLQSSRDEFPASGDPTISERAAASNLTDIAGPGLVPKSESRAATLRKRIGEEWNQAWQRLLAEPRTTARDEDMVTLIEELAATDPERAIAVAQGETDLELRGELLHAALRGWGGANPESAIAWAASQGLLDEGEAVAAIFHGAARDPENAIRLALKLAAQDPARDYGIYLVAGLSRAGEFSQAVDFALNGAPEARAELLKVIYSRWSDSEPEAALKSIAQLSNPDIRQTAFDAAITRWTKSDAKAVGEYALTLPEGHDRTLALSLALRAWSATDPVAAASWMGRFEPSSQQDLGAAMVASHQEALLQPEIAAGWAESIVDPWLRVRVLASVVNAWSAIDPVAARHYAETSPNVRPEDRAGLLAAFEPGFGPISLAP